MSNYSNNYNKPSGKRFNNETPNSQGQQRTHNNYKNYDQPRDQEQA